MGIHTRTCRFALRHFAMTRAGGGMRSLDGMDVQCMHAPAGWIGDIQVRVARPFCPPQGTWYPLRRIPPYVWPCAFHPTHRQRIHPRSIYPLNIHTHTHTHRYFFSSLPLSLISNPIPCYSLPSHLQCNLPHHHLSPPQPFPSLINLALPSTTTVYHYHYHYLPPQPPPIYHTPSSHTHRQNTTTASSRIADPLHSLARLTSHPPHTYTHQRAILPHPIPSTYAQPHS